MKKLIYTSVLLMLLTITVNAQQIPLSSLYTVNRFQINSAYAGFNECLEGFLSHRSQWTGIQGAPKTNYLSVHSGIAKNMGLGLNLVMDKTDIISKLRGSLSYSYRIKLGEQHNLRFGLSAGIYQLGTSTSSAIVDDRTDEIIQSGNQSSTAFSNDFSLYYTYKKLQVGISIPQLIEINAKYDLNNAEGGFGLKRHLVGYAEYDISLGNNLSLQPSLLYKTVNGIQGQLDVSAQVNYKQLFFIGAGYRTEAGLLARLGLNLKDKFTVAYAYDFAGGNINNYSGGAHEIVLGLKLCKKSKPEIKEIIPPAPVVVEVVPEPMPETDTVVVPEPIPVREDTTQKVFDVDGANAEFKKRKNIIRYGNNVSANTTSANETRLVNYVVEVLKNNPGLNVLVEGHSCDKGSETLNQNLSEKRAQKIAGLIIAKGISKDRVSAKGKGESTPLKPNTSEANRIENRRVQMRFSKTL